MRKTLDRIRVTNEWMAFRSCEPNEIVLLYIPSYTFTEIENVANYAEILICYSMDIFNDSI